jgi:hypothetical protein
MKAGAVINELELPLDDLHEVMADLGVEGPSIVEPVAYDSGSPATGALARVKGDGWSVFVKQIQAVRHWPRLFLVPQPLRDDFAAGFPWRAELAIWDEPFAGRLPEHLRVPKLYRLTDLGDDRLLIWMENVDALSDADWTLDHFTRAATVLGGLAARRMDSATLAATGTANGSGLRMYVDGRVYHYALPKLQDDEVWRHPRLAEAPAGLRARLAALAEHCDTILDRLDRLPQAVPHGDASPQNLLVPRSAPDDFVAIDVSFQHPLAIGFDLGQLLVGLAHAGHVDPARLPEIHERLVPAYVAGMAEAGYDADPADVHYGYVASLLVRTGFTSIPYELLTAPDTGALFRRRLELTEFLADIGTEII